MNNSKPLQKASRRISQLPVMDYVLRCVLPSKIQHGPKGIHAVGHRRYVGGDWEQIGQIQFEFMIRHGLEPHHYLLDIGCGNLRGGVHFIQYLQPGHYLGIDKEAELIEQGVRDELGQACNSRQRPQLVVSSEFEFEKFGTRVDFALAQSLFTHLPMAMVQACLERLPAVMNDQGVLYATFWESDGPRRNPPNSHDHKQFFYTRNQMEQMGRDHGWKPRYIGPWGHPRNQMMMSYHLDRRGQPQP